MKKIELSNSRYLSTLDVPEPFNIRAAFNYNFFVKNEKTDRSGNLKHDGPSHLLKNNRQDPVSYNEAAVLDSNIGAKIRAYEVKVPRNVELVFDRVSLNNESGKFDVPLFLIKRLRTEDPLKVLDEYANLEENVTSIKDVILKVGDVGVHDRLQKKLNFASQLLNVNIAEIQNATDALLAEENFDENALEYILGQDSQAEVKYVNSISNPAVKPAFDITKNSVLDSAFDARFLKILNSSAVNRTDFNKTNNEVNFERLRTVAESLATDDSIADFESTLRSFEAKEVDSYDSRALFDARVIGYIIFKNEITADGLMVPVKKYFLEGFEGKDVTPQFLDSEVVYGSTYHYNARTVVLVKRLHLSNGTDGLKAGRHVVHSILVSRESDTVSVQAIETAPPGEPDSIFYDYIYGKGGLRISWRMPTNRQRDTKYIQVFRRQSINEPFQCIAEIDFDDSEVKSPKTEFVDSTRVSKHQSAITNYVDSEFTRNSKYIYALAAVDAHGMSSGYSRQAMVSFDRINNELIIEPISRTGAPKQYPNFYIDPSMDDNIFVDSMTVDSMRLSNARKLTFYFDPDAITYVSNNGDASFVVRDQKQGAEYKFHAINLDRQKDQIITIKTFTAGD